MARERSSSVTTLQTSVGIALCIVSIAAFITGCDLLPRPPAPTAADYCHVTLTPPESNDVILKVWAADARQHCLRLYAPVLAATGLDGISVVAVEKNVNIDPFRSLLVSAIEQQNAPDIVFFPNGNALRKLADSGYLYPVRNCDLPEKDWTSEIFLQREWGLPFEVETLMLFYSKRILKKLGWHDERIEKLPDEIANGTFTLSDLLTIATEAVEMQVVDKGFAFTVHESQFYSAMHIFKSFGGLYSNKPGDLENNQNALVETYKYYERLRDHKLMHAAISQPSYSNVTNRFAIRDALANGRILFAHTVVSEWKRMLLDHVKDEPSLRENIGVALFPTAKTQGSVMMNAMGSYVILSEKATGKTNQAAACRVVSAIANSDLHRQHATNTSQLAPEPKGIWVPSALPTFTLNMVHYGFNYSPEFGLFVTHVTNMTSLLAKGEISAEQAASLSLRQLQKTFR